MEYEIRQKVYSIKTKILDTGLKESGSGTLLQRIKTIKGKKAFLQTNLPWQQIANDVWSLQVSGSNLGLSRF